MVPMDSKGDVSDELCFGLDLRDATMSRMTARTRIRMRMQWNNTYLFRHRPPPSFAYHVSVIKKPETKNVVFWKLGAVYSLSRFTRNNL